MAVAMTIIIHDKTMVGHGLAIVLMLWLLPKLYV